MLIKTDAGTKASKVITSHQVLILDESGSMQPMKDSVVSGVNEILSSIRSLDGKEVSYLVTIIKFNSFVSVLCTGNKVEELGEMESSEYQPRDLTALYDAIGKGVCEVERLRTPSDNVVITIFSDGNDNCSRDYDKTMISSLIKRKKGANWEFIFVGTPGLESEARDIGIESTMIYEPTLLGVKGVMLDVTKDIHARHRTLQNNK